MSRGATVLVTGYAKAPHGTSMYEVYKHAGIVIEIDPESNRIVDAEFTFVTDLAKRFLRDILVGFDLDEGSDRLCERVMERYLAPSRHSVVTCIRVALQRYDDWRQSGDPEPGLVVKG